MKEVYKVWCEYELGIEDTIFANRDMALNAAKQAARDCGISEEEIKELIEGNLLVVKKLDFLQE